MGALREEKPHVLNSDAYLCHAGKAIVTSLVHSVMPGLLIL
jgi:hypothetical protein